jgi:hypothetical protein
LFRNSCVPFLVTKSLGRAVVAAAPEVAAVAVLAVTTPATAPDRARATIDGTTTALLSLRIFTLFCLR